MHATQHSGRGRGVCGGSGGGVLAPQPLMTDPIPIMKVSGLSLSLDESNLAPSANHRREVVILLHPQVALPLVSLRTRMCYKTRGVASISKMTVSPTANQLAREGSDIVRHDDLAGLGRPAAALFDDGLDHAHHGRSKLQLLHCNLRFEFIL